MTTQFKPVDWTGKVITCTSPAAKTIDASEFYIKNWIQSHKDKFLFSFEQNEDGIRFLVYLFKSTDDSENHYSLYYKFEKDKFIKKEISRTNIFKDNLFKYVEMDIWELKRNYYSKYIELENICLNLQTA